MTLTQEQNQALADGYFFLAVDMLADECEVRPVQLVLGRIENLLAVDYPLRPVLKGTHRDILEGIHSMAKESGTTAGKNITALVESILFHAPPHYGSGW